jgi:orotidine-5'-phosphate decarboxylase
MAPKLIVALDFDNRENALSLVDALEPTDCALKVGHELFTRFGSDFVTSLIHRKFNVFLDLKLYDIPNTVAKACKAIADLGVWMTNVHASGGRDMLIAAREALEEYGSDRPLLIAVTVLTSFNPLDLPSVGISQSLTQQVTQLAILTQQARLDGVVCSPHEAALIKDLCSSSFLTVTN